VKVLAWYDNEWGYVKPAHGANAHRRSHPSEGRLTMTGARPPALAQAKAASDNLRNYILVTRLLGDTLTDGALRISSLSTSTSAATPHSKSRALCLLRVFGIVTNLVGGWLAAGLDSRPHYSAGWARNCSRYRCSQ